MRILIVEDAQVKAIALQNAIKEGHIVTICKSVNEARRQIIETDFDLAILDMNLPTYSAGTYSQTGRNQSDGGIELMRYIHRHRSSSKIIVFTQFEALEIAGKNITTVDIDEMLKKAYKSNYMGLVKYSVSTTEWIDIIKEMISTSESSDS